MQKKIIALAVAGLVSGVAFAQSNVTIYGAIDVSDVYAWDNFNSKTKNLNAISSGAAGLNGTRIGFRGVEDLGNGLQAKFRMEAGINADTGVSAQGGQLMGRWATVSLAGNSWGEVQAGRRDTFQDELLGSAAANGRNTIANGGIVYVDQSRYDNFVAYLSPVWSGLQLKAGYSSQGNDGGAAAQDVAPTQITSALQNTAANTNNRVYTVAVHYVNGPLLVGAAYDYNKLQDRSSAVAGVDGSYNAGNVWNIAGAYDFGVVRLDAAYGMINYAENSFYDATSGLQLGEVRDSRKQWALGAVVPFGAKDRFMATYAHANISYTPSGVGDDTVAMWGLNYMHDFSKRTTLYASYANVRQDKIFNVAGSRVGGIGGVTGGYEQGVQIGVRHFF